MDDMPEGSPVPADVVFAAARARWAGQEEMSGYDSRVARQAASPTFRSACQSVWDAAQSVCSCQSWPPEGPAADCAVHGAVRAFNQASAELNRLREDFDLATTNLAEACRAYEEVCMVRDVLAAKVNEDAAELAHLSSLELDTYSDRVETMTAEIKRLKAELEHCRDRPWQND